MWNILLRCFSQKAVLCKKCLKLQNLWICRLLKMKQYECIIVNFVLIVQGKNKNRHTLCYTYVAGLFRRVIIQSGSPLAQWSYSDKVTSPDIHFKIFVSSIGCLRNSSRLIKECLQNIPTEVMHRQISFKYVVGRKDINIYS